MIEATSSPATGVPVGRVVAALLATATAILVFRLPGAVVLSAVAPVAALLCAGVYRPRRDSAPLWVFLGSAIVSAGIAVVIAAEPAPMVNYATLALVFALFAAAILATGTQMSASRAVMKTLYAAFGITMLIGWAEVISGFKLQSVLYPDAANLRFPGRFFVAAYFPNYNDFGVVVAMFAIMAVARVCFDPGRLGTQATRLAAAAAGAVLILAGGSRGALAGLLIGWALVVFLYVRMTRHHPLSGALVLVLGLGAGAGALYVWSLPVIQDNSTHVRGRIVGDTIALSLEHPSTVWFGWAYQDAFLDAAKLAYPSKLMDPHNLLLELFTWFGLPTLLAFLVLWVAVVYQGVWLARVRDHWTAVTAVVVFALTPVLGVVPSSSLRYYYLFLLASCAVVALSPTVRGATR